jgi:hypothetical protein
MDFLPTFHTGALAALAVLAALGAWMDDSRCQVADLAEPAHLRDRGTGLPTSLFGTYVRGGELIVYPFYEYTLNRNQEYKPSELGFAGDEDFRGRRVDHEALLFVAYGVTPNLVIEGESALYADAIQRKSANDPSAVPPRLSESGLGDTEMQVRYRWRKETARAPEVFTYSEVTFPLQRERLLIGTSDWEVSQGLGLIKGSRAGTFTARAALNYSPEGGSVEAGQYALEYLRRTSPQWRWVLSLEGEQDEVAMIAEAQVRLGRNAFLKLNNGFGITSKAPDLAPEIGIAFSFR